MRTLESHITRYIEPVYRFCLKRLASRDDADDLAQEILAHVLNGLSKYAIQDMDAWIWAVAHNRYARFIDDRARRANADDALVHLTQVTSETDTADEIVLVEEHQAVFTALHSIAKTYRDIMVDYYVHELPVAIIADKHHITPTSVKWRLHVGRELVRERMVNVDRVYQRINWETTTCNGNIDVNHYLHSQIARAICLTAYREPVTIEEISLATGIPAIYIEDEAPRLMHGDALTQVGRKYVTNFIILGLDDNRRLQQALATPASRLADIVLASADEQADNIKRIGFHGSNAGIDRLGHLIVPLVVRKAIENIQQSDVRLAYGPFPPRKDGGYGWFIVQETQDETERCDLAASGRNAVSDHRSADKGRFYYYWVGKYFSKELYRKGLQWMSQQELMQRIDADNISKSQLTNDEMARLIQLNLIGKVNGEYRLAIPVFTEEQWRQFKQLFTPVAAKLQHELATPVFEIWSEFRKLVPDHLHGQVNQYLAGFMHHLVGMVIFDLMEKRRLAAPPAEGPLPYGVCFVGNNVASKSRSEQLRNEV